MSKLAEFEAWKKAISAKADVDERSLVRFWNSGYCPDDVLLVFRTYQLCNAPKEVFDGVKRCGCFHCLRFFEPKDIIDWEGAAWCPHCHIDSVLPETDDYKLTPELLKKLQVMQFSPNSVDDFDMVNDLADRLRGLE